MRLFSMFCSAVTRDAHRLRWVCMRLQMLCRCAGCSRSSTSGSRLAGDETEARMTGKNCGMAFNLEQLVNLDASK